MRALIWLTVAVVLVNLVAFGLTDLDEGFYASVAWEMHQRGDWLTPTFKGEPWFEKPPFLYWLMGLSQTVFGENLFALRLPSALMFVLTLVVLGHWGNRRLGAGLGTLSALLFALSPLSFLLAHLAITDMTLTALLLVALIALWELPTRPLLWSVVGGLALGNAVLTKGPVGLVLVGLLFLWNLRLLNERGLKSRWVGMALGVALLTCLPWYIGVYLKHGGEFFNEFVVRQNLLRFAGGDTAHSALALMTAGGAGNFVAGLAVYLLFYVLVLGLGALPMIGGVSVLWSRDPDPLRTYLRRWALLVFGLFTLSFTKLPAYIFPMFPALALLVAYRLSQGVLSDWSFYLSKISQAVWLTLGGAIAWISGAYWAIGLGVGYLVWHIMLRHVSLTHSLRALTENSASPLALTHPKENLTPPSPLSASREGGEAGHSPSPFTERGLGGEVNSETPFSLPLTQAESVPKSPSPFTERGLGGEVKPPVKANTLLIVSTVLILIGFNGALVGYDRIALQPVRELALSAPNYRTLIAYRVNPSYPSLQFYRKGRYASSAEPNAVLQQMRSEGAYCLTTDAEFARNSAVILVRQRKVMDREFFLLAPRYDQPL